MRLHLIASVLSFAMVAAGQVSAPVNASDQTQKNTLEKCRIAGRVVSLTMGTPLNKVTLHLRMVNTPGTAATNPVSAGNFVTSSDSDGNFLFEDLDTGRYLLSAERQGYVRANYGARSATMTGTPLTLESGSSLKGIEFKMTPQGIIAGKVTDVDGDPLGGGQVQAYRFVYVRGRKQLQPAAGGSINADGSFLMGNLPPGRYYIAGTDNRAMLMGPPERPGRRGVNEEHYVTTYFPSAIESGDGTPVEILPGAEVRGIEIRLRKARVFRISGKVLNAASSAPVQNVMLMLRLRDNSNGAMFSRPRTTMVQAADGAFEFPQVLPGNYVIQANPNANMNGQKTSRLVGRQSVTVTDEDVEGAILMLGPGVDLAGTIKIDGAEGQNAAPLMAPQSAGRQRTVTSTMGFAAPNPGQPGISLIAEGVGFNMPNTQVNADGTFEFQGVAPEKYRVNVFNLPDGTYLKSVRFGGQDLPENMLDVTSGTDGVLDILLRPGAAEVAGAIHDDTGKGIAGIIVSIWNSKAPATAEADSVKTATTDQKGSFRVRNLPPGDYRIIAWEDIEPGLLQSPDLRKQFESRASSVTLREYSNETADVTIIKKEAIEAAEAGMR